MRNQTLLFVMSDKTPDSELRDVLNEAQTQNARVICLILFQSPFFSPIGMGVPPYGSFEYPVEWVEQMNACRAKLKERSDAVETLLQATGAPGDVHPVMCTPADVREIVARRALVCDTAALAPSLRQAEPDLFNAAALAVLFDAPVGLLLNGPPLDRPEKIMIAWNAQLPASRAAHAALPLLRRAKEIVIACFDPHAVAFEDGEDPGTDLAEWLSHHGCTVTVSQFPSGGEGLATTIRHRARELGADLVVMGAYGHSRMRQQILGGTTRDMLDQTDTPVFMAH